MSEYWFDHTKTNSPTCLWMLFVNPMKNLNVRTNIKLGVGKKI